MSNIESDFCVNVVIIGGGFAGLAAGIEARLVGASVLLVEKMARPGGNSIISDGGMNAAGSSMQKTQGINDSPELMYQDMLKVGQGLNNPSLARAVAENSVETLEWTRDFLGVKFKDRVDHFGGHSIARTHITQRASGVDIIKPLSAKFQELGGKLRLKTLMRELITKPNEGVIGVKLQSGFSLKKGGQGETYRILADQTAVDQVGWDLSQALAKGVVSHFDSLAKLADHYGLNRSGLEKSVSRYNEFQKQRQDPDFAKPILADSRPIAVPPFYAARIWPKVHYTMGGARIDAKARVLDLDGQPIPKLFAAGEVTGGVHGACRLGSNAITECLYFGRVAGRMASKLSKENAS